MVPGYDRSPWATEQEILQIEAQLRFQNSPHLEPVTHQTSSLNLIEGIGWAESYTVPEEELLPWAVATPPLDTSGPYDNHYFGEYAPDSLWVQQNYIHNRQQESWYDSQVLPDYSYDYYKNQWDCSSHISPPINTFPSPYRADSWDYYAPEAPKSYIAGRVIYEPEPPKSFFKKLRWW